MCVAEATRETLSDEAKKKQPNVLMALNEKNALGNAHFMSHQSSTEELYIKIR